MTNLNKVAKIILGTTVIFFIIWIGGYIARQLVVYRFFDAETMELLELYNSETLTQVLQTVLPLFVLNIITFSLFLLSYLFFLVISKISLRQEGWLFIITLIIVITAPFEIYLLKIDYNIIRSIYSLHSDPMVIIELIRDRILTINSFSLIETFSYLGVIVLALFKPLQKKPLT